MTSSPAPDLDELERLAKAATPGPWVAQSADDGLENPWYVDSHAYPGGPEPVVAEGYSLDDRDAAYIAAASPDAILALITELRAAREAAAPTPLAPPAGISPVETAGHSSPAARSAAGPDVAAETVAGWFHEAYERLAPDYGYRTRKASAVPWADVPLTNRALMVRVAAEVLALLATPPAPSDHGACTNCHHAYAEHTGRSLRPYTMRRLPSGLGPPELRPGWCCEHLEDALHTCPCPQFFAATPPAPSDHGASGERLALDPCGECPIGTCDGCDQCVWSRQFAAPSVPPEETRP